MIVECPGCRLRYDLTGRPAHTNARCRCGTVFELPSPSQSAAYLRCPQCSAAVVDAGAAQCSYCQAQLLIKACPRCFGRMFHGAKHCVHCGAAVQVAAHADASGDALPRACPRCATPDVTLETRLVAPYALDECMTCHGIYVDAATLERILAARSQTCTAWAMKLPRQRTDAALAPQTGPMYVRCPDCEGLMNRCNFGRSSGVIVDVCKFHGTWFDRDELPRVIAFVGKGGLERAALQEIERQRAELSQVRATALPSQGSAVQASHRGGGIVSDLVNLAGAIGELFGSLKD